MTRHTHLGDGASVLGDAKERLLVRVSIWLVQSRRDGELQPGGSALGSPQGSSKETTRGTCSESGEGGKGRTRLIWVATVEPSALDSGTKFCKDWGTDCEVEPR